MVYIMLAYFNPISLIFPSITTCKEIKQSLNKSLEFHKTIFLVCQEMCSSCLIAYLGVAPHNPNGRRNPDWCCCGLRIWAGSESSKELYQNQDLWYEWFILDLASIKLVRVMCAICGRNTNGAQLTVPQCETHIFGENVHECCFYKITQIEGSPKILDCQ